MITKKRREPNSNTDKKAENIGKCDAVSIFRRREPIGRYIIGALILIMLYFKCVNFYLLLGNRAYSLVFAAATSLIVCGVYFIIGIFSPKAANATAMTVYVLLSIIFAITSVYFAYSQRLPSFYLLSMAKQVGAVEGTVTGIITYRHILFLIDLPLWAAYGITRSVIKKISIKRPNSEKQTTAEKIFGVNGTIKLPRFAHTVSVASGSALLAIFIVLSICFTNFSASFLKNEIFAFYASDIKKMIVKNNRRVDISNYIDQTGPNAYFGLTKGMNLVVIQVEALQSFAIGTTYKGEEIAPNLNALIKNDSFYFDNYYYQVGAGNTSDAEFTVNNSLFSTEELGAYSRYTDNDYYGLPWLMKDQGYGTSVFHGNVPDFWNRDAAYVKQGFDVFYSSDKMDPNSERHDHAAKGGISDRSMFSQAADILSSSDSPFYSFIITLSTHNPFSVPPADRYIDADNPSPDLVALYVQSVKYFDTTLGEFIDKLKENGLYEDTVFVIYGDHYAISSEITNGKRYAPVVSEEILNREFTYFDWFNVPLIIHIPGMNKAETIHTVGGHVDVMPTLLNLFGIRNYKSVMFGHNLFDTDYKGTVYEMMHVGIGSYITNDIFYRTTSTNPIIYTKDGNETAPSDEYNEISEKARQAISDCQALLDGNQILID